MEKKNEYCYKVQGCGEVEKEYENDCRVRGEGL